MNIELSTDTSVIRGKNLRARRLQSVIDNVADRLDVFACVLAARKLLDDRNGTFDPAVYATFRKEHAERIVHAVIALTRGDR